MSLGNVDYISKKPDKNKIEERLLLRIWSKIMFCFLVVVKVYLKAPFTEGSVMTWYTIGHQSQSGSIPGDGPGRGAR